MNAITHIPDLVEGRRGEWMHLSSGGKFFPADPRPEEIKITDIANGLALDCRYGGQGDIDRFYSVAEHCVKMARYAHSVHYHGWFCMAVLLHDAAEAYLNDLPKAVKHAVGEGYGKLEDHLQDMIFQKYGVLPVSRFHAHWIKDIDSRITVNEKAAVMRYQQPWACDSLQPLAGVEIECWAPWKAKAEFLNEYGDICDRINMEKEITEL